MNCGSWRSADAGDDAARHGYPPVMPPTCKQNSTRHQLLSDLALKHPIL